MGSLEKPNYDYDVLIIGAGLSGIYSLHRIRELGLSVRVLEAGGGEGGTWYWNRYPGCRFDSESYSYGYSFSKEVLDEWTWTEHFAPQPETLRYCQHVTDKFDLRKDMQFNTKIKSAHYQEVTRTWLLTDIDGGQYTSRFLVTAMGVLNEPTLPNIPGIEIFQGEAFHTARWPSKWDFTNKRVGIIGTGATAIQAIPELATKTNLKSLTVFQRTPNWSTPLHNDLISPEEMDHIRSTYPEIFALCASTPAGFMHQPDPRTTFSVSKDERLALWEDCYHRRGFAKWLAPFGDMHIDRAANAAYSEFIADKIRSRVRDSATAEKLIPKCHGFGTRRVPMESGYFEAFNLEHVRLVDKRVDGGIERIVENGVEIEGGEVVELDVLIYATGFDAVTGALANGIDLRGIRGVTPSHLWKEGIRTYLGLFLKGFPNMCMIMGPHQMFGNIPRSIEFAVEWVSKFLGWCFENGVTYAEATEKGVEEWTQHVLECSKGMLANEVDSWMTGVNKNVKGKQKRIVARYSGPASGYRKRVDNVAERKYEDLVLKK